MSLAMFKLESFGIPADPQPPAPSYGQADLDRAFAEGIACARAEAEDAQMRSLTAGLSQVAEGLAAEDGQRHALRQEVLEALLPVLHHVLDLMAPPLASRRLEEALGAELARLAHRARPLGLQIACGARLEGLVRRCLDRAGLEGVALDPHPEDRITVSLQGGRIEFNPEAVAAEIRALIAELAQETGTWTP